MSKVHPFLWFDTQAEEAANLYVSIFPNSKVTKVVRNTAAAPGPTNGVLTVEFELDGTKVIALNGGPHFKFTEAFSFTIDCETQAEVDRYWDALLAGGGQPSQCGWLKDRFGLSWQVVPAALPKLLGDPDRAKANRVMAAMMKMVKLDIAAMEAAAAEPVAG
ncbi:MAG: VOC family protein [Phenylobacterium sp.]|nr:MAG: VOC family protein [Phenylobacterium sp.]